MTLLNIFLAALQGAAANKLRATLTTLGIVIGVGSVIATLALGNGARAAVEQNFRFLGADEVQISAAMALDEDELVAAGKILSYEDGLRLPEAASLVNRVDMEVHGNSKVRFGRAALELTVIGTTATALEKLAASGVVQPVGWKEGEPLTPEDFLASGRIFTTAETLQAAHVCVLGSEIAEDLFSGDDPLGQTVWVNRSRCQVVGVLKELESTDESDRYTTNPNRGFYMPISAAMSILFEEETSVAITAHVSDESRIDEAKAQIAAYLRQRHAIEKDADGSYQDDFNLTTRKDILGAQQEAARTFALLLAAMSAVSLTVGGIGIMNVMLVSVSERTREIGVRMAIGARPRDIVFQFLTEATLISAFGGLLGVTVGILSIPLAAVLNNGQALLQPNSIPLALGVALLTGIVFGIYPALRAARLDPIDALRYE